MSIVCCFLFIFWCTHATPILGPRTQRGGLEDIIHDIEQHIYTTLPAVVNNPYKDTPAQVRTGATICPQEIAYLQQRKPCIKSSLEIALGRPVASVPTIALLCSGGGYRSTLYATGILKALDELKILDTLSYAVGLSGSTWALATWISSGKSIQEFHDWLVQNISFKPPTQDDFTFIADIILTKYYLGKSVGFADIYGACIANDLFDFFTSKKDEVFLSVQAAIIAQGKFPMPIYTSINAMTSQSENLWYEFNPFEVGAPWLNTYIPTWAFGRKFKDGTSLYNDPEETLASLMGTFGLAVGISLSDAFTLLGICDLLQSSLLKKIVDDIVQEAGNDRPISSYFWNFALGISAALLTETFMELVDAGLNINIPYPPVSGQTAGRTADIIIIADASAGKVGVELRKVELYAQAHSLPFPPIDYSTIGSQAFHLFNASTPGIPIVLYIPRVVDQNLLEAHKVDLADLYSYLHGFDIEGCINQGSCNTFNFIYSPYIARSITALAEFNMKMAYPILLNAYNTVTK